MVDIPLVHEQRRAEHDLAAADFDPSEPPGLDRRRAGRKGLTHQLRRGQHRQIAEISRVPQDDGLDDEPLRVDGLPPADPPAAPPDS